MAFVLGAEVQKTEPQPNPNPIFKYPLPTKHDFGKAIETCQEGLKHDTNPNPISFCLVLCNHLPTKQEFDKAIETYQEGLKHDPENQELKDGLLRCVQAINKVRACNG